MWITFSKKHKKLYKNVDNYSKKVKFEAIFFTYPLIHMLMNLLISYSHFWWEIINIFSNFLWIECE